MSKTRGNIEYPRDLLATECIWSHIRFFFIYGHYRRKMNFTFQKYNQVCSRLKSFRAMVQELSAAEETKTTNLTAKKLIKEITTDFEKNMNVDLQVKAAFNSMYKTVSKLVNLKEKNKLGLEDLKEALAKPPVKG